MEFNENSMDIACGVLNKFDFFIVNCYSHLNAFNNNHTPNISLIKVRSYYKFKLLDFIQVYYYIITENR